MFANTKNHYEDEFEVYYQPKVFTKDHVLCGGEALVRWNKDGKIINLNEEDEIISDETIGSSV